MKKLIKPLLIVLSIVLIVTIQLGFIFLLLGLLPSVIAYYLDSHSEKATFKTIAACNLAAMLPWLVPILIAGAQFKQYDSYALMVDPYVWLVVLGGPTVAWCLVYICSFASSFVVSSVYEYNAASLERFQKKLIEEWGEDIIPKNE
jgi:hypothetical protein